MRAALKEIGDKQIWVQGHTDDQPIFSKKPKAATGDTAELFAQFMQLAKDGAATPATADAAPTPYQQHKQKLSGAHKQPQKGA